MANPTFDDIKTTGITIGTQHFTYDKVTGYFTTQTSVRAGKIFSVMPELDKLYMDKFTLLVEICSIINKGNATVLITTDRDGMYSNDYKKSWFLVFNDIKDERIMSIEILLTEQNDDKNMFDISIKADNKKPGTLPILQLCIKKMSINALLDNIRNIELLLRICQGKKRFDTEYLIKNITCQFTHAYSERKLLSYFTLNKNVKVDIKKTMFNEICLTFDFSNTHNLTIMKCLELKEHFDVEKKFCETKELIENDICQIEANLAKKKYELEQVQKLLNDNRVKTIEIECMLHSEREFLKNECYVQNFENCLEQIKNHKVQLKQVKVPETTNTDDQLPSSNNNGDTNNDNTNNDNNNDNNNEIQELITFLKSHEQLTREASIMDFETFFAINDNLTTKQQINYVEYYTLDNTQRGYVDSKLVR